MPNYWHQVTSETFGVQQFKLAIGKVDGIEIELAIFCGRTRKLVKNWIHLLFRQLLGNENRYYDGEKVGIYIYKKNAFWVKQAIFALLWLPEVGRVRQNTIR